MRSFIVLPAVAAVLLASCVSTKDLSRTRSIDVINARGPLENAQVYLANPDRGPYDALNVRVGVDSTTWIDPSTLRLRSVATSSVVAITFREYGRGALEGLGVGLLTGVSAGALIGFAGGGHSFLFSAGDQAIMGGVLGGGAGAVVGLLSGTVTGSTDRYELIPSQATRVSSRAR